MVTSVIIPTYNRAHLITRAIRNVLAQSVANWELIVVDDGSTDNTGTVMQEFLTDKRIKYYKKNNSGAAESRNIGVEKATGELITFLDSDDEADPTWLEKMIGAVETNTLAVVCCGLERFDAKGRSLGVILPGSMAPLFENVSGRFTNGGVFLMHREIFLAIGGFDPLLRSGQHTEMSFRLIPYLIQHNIKIFNVMEPLIKVHVHDGPRIRYNSDAIFQGAIHILEKHEALFKRNKPQYIVFLAMAGVSGVRTKRYNEAKKYFRKALRQNPYRLLSWSRWLLSYVPVLRDQIWKAEGRNVLKYHKSF